MKFNNKEEFIKSVMAGDVWEDRDYKYYYDSTQINPFRLGDVSMDYSWNNITTREFTLVEPKPIIERRWKMLKDRDGFTDITNCYYSQEQIDSGIDSCWKGWYKHLTDFIDVEVKGETK